MKIAVVLGNFSVGSRPIDMNYAFSNPRGLTGTDLATLMLAKELAILGHETHLFTVFSPNQQPTTWENVFLHRIEEKSIIDDTYHAVISFNEPDIFIGMTDKPFRICWNMLNDFHFSQPDCNSRVDKFLGVCEQHTNYLKSQVPNSDGKWDTIELGCDPSWYENKKVPGRVVWCSSADRGLHWLLSIWPEVKESVPNANLKIFYHFNYGDLEKIEPDDKTNHIHVVEMANRIRYMKYAIQKLKDFGVEHVGSISRDQIAKEWSEASVFAFTCDTIAFSEGFSVSTLEAHASGTVPIITSQDCLGGIYKNSGCLMVDAPVGENLEQFKQYIIKSLTDQEFANQVTTKCKEFANQYTWSIAAQKMEKLINDSKKSI